MAAPSGHVIEDRLDNVRGRRIEAEHEGVPVPFAAQEPARCGPGYLWAERSM